MKKLSFYLSLVLFLASTSLALSQSAICPSSYIPLPSQDCKGAISLATQSYTYPTGSICGAGFVPDELGIGSCLRTSERTTTWYSFKVSRSGIFKVLIYPLDLDNLDGNSGTTDYDFALIKLPARLRNDSATCSLINRNSFDTAWFQRCNYSGQRGITGISDTGIIDGYAKIEDPIFVRRNDFYLFAVDNFSSGINNNRVGYTIRFGDFSVQLNASIAPITEVEEFSRQKSIRVGEQNIAIACDGAKLTAELFTLDGRLISRFKEPGEATWQIPKPNQAAMLRITDDQRRVNFVRLLPK